MTDQTKPDHMQEIRERHADAIARFWHHFKSCGLFGQPCLTVGVQSFQLAYDFDYTDMQCPEPEYREWIGIMLCAALKNLVEEHTADLAAPVKVKALEWEIVGYNDYGFPVVYDAVGHKEYRVMMLDGEWRARHATETIYNTAARAKAAAQAHHDALVRSMLEPAPVSQTRAKVPEGAIAALADYQQADMEGIFVTVSRQAIEEVLEYIRALSPAPDSKEQALTDLAREGQKWDADSKEGGE